MKVTEWDKQKLGRVSTLWLVCLSSTSLRRVLNIQLEWQSAVVLSSLAKLRNSPPAAECINLAALQNLQFKHRGRRVENENVNLTGRCILRFLCSEREEEILPSASFSCLWPLSFASYLINLNRLQWDLILFTLKHSVCSSALQLSSLPEVFLCVDGKRKWRQKEWMWAQTRVAEIIWN